MTRNPNLSIPNYDQVKSDQRSQLVTQLWWTGLSPQDCPGFDSNSQTLKALPLINLSQCNRQDVLDYFNNTWTLTELIFSGLLNEQAFMKAAYHQLRHPLIFYYGHPCVLYVNKLRLAGLLDHPLDLYLEKVLETGVDEMSWDDMSKNEQVWPTVAQVHGYRALVYQLVRDIILKHPELDPEYRQSHQIEINLEHPLWALFMGFEHEKIHFETSSVLMRELPFAWVERPKYWPHTESFQDQSTEISNPWIRVESGPVKYGKSKGVPSFGWDNEYGQREVVVKGFQVTQQLVSNREFYDFVKSGAYVEDRYWSTEGLKWRKFRNSKRPCFWVAHGPEGLHDYQLRTVFEVLAMPWDWPVEVNYHEASAYAQWRQEQDQSPLKYRMITEAEHHRMRDWVIGASHDVVLQKQSPIALQVSPYHYNFSSSSPRPVTQDAAPIKDIFGNLWQWAKDHFSPLEGFRAHTMYDDFSTPCFDGKHQMILGGSFMSCGHEASQYARFHFRPHFFQHAGFRLSATLDGSDDNAALKISHQAESSYIHTQRVTVTEQMQQEDWWKDVTNPLEVDSSTITNLFQQSLQKLESVLTLGKVLPTTPISGVKKPIDFKLKAFPAAASDPQDLLNYLVTEVAPQGEQVGAAGYMAYVAGAAHPYATLGQMMAHAFNQYTAHFNLSPGLVNLEREAIGWFLDLLGWKTQSSYGFFTSGGSLSNLSALQLAFKTKRTVDQLGQYRFYTSHQAHHCIAKALSFLGFPLACLHFVRVNEQLQMDCEHLQNLIEQDQKAGYLPIAVISTFGSTNTGAIDDLEKVQAICQQKQLWHHVDGAYGFVFTLTSQHQSSLMALAQCDSISFDPHKGLQVPYGLGGLLVKDQGHRDLHHQGAMDYMPEADHLDYADITPELSRDPRGLRLWLPIKIFGIEPFRVNLEEKLKLAQYTFAELSKLSQVMLGPAPQLSVVSFRLATQELTQQLLNQLNKDPELFLSQTTLNNKMYIRICLLSYRLHFKQVQHLLERVQFFLHQG